MCSSSCKNLFHISFCTILWSFWFSTLRNFWIKIVSKRFSTFTGYYIVIYMGPCRGSYILLGQKFRTSKMLEKWSPKSKLSEIKMPYYLKDRYIFCSGTRARLSAIPIKPVFSYLQIFSPSNLFIMIEFWLYDNMSTLPI